MVMVMVMRMGKKGRTTKMRMRWTMVTMATMTMMSGLRRPRNRVGKEERDMGEEEAAEEAEEAAEEEQVDGKEGDMEEGQEEIRLVPLTSCPLEAERMTEGLGEEMERMFRRKRRFMGVR